MYIVFMTRHMSHAIRLRTKNTSQLTVGNTEKNVYIYIYKYKYIYMYIYIYIYIVNLSGLIFGLH